MPALVQTDSHSLHQLALLLLLQQVSSSTVEEVALYNNSGAAYAADTSLMTGLTDLFVVAGNQRCLIHWC